MLVKLCVLLCPWPWLPFSNWLKAPDLKYWLTIRLPSLVFLPSSICSGSSNVTPASVVLLSTSLSTPPPLPPLVSPLPPFTQLMPRYTGMHACTHLLRIPVLPHLWLFQHIKLKIIVFMFFVLGSFVQVSFRTQGWGSKVDLCQSAVKSLTDEF